MSSLPPPVAMLEVIKSFWLSRAVCVAAELRIPDLLHAGPKTAEQLADGSASHTPSLYRLLRALASVGVLHEGADGRFSSTPLADTLRSDAPGSLRALVMAELASDHYPAWGGLLHGIKTGEIPFHHVYGKDAWAHRAEHPEDGAIFDQAMSDFGSVVNHTVIESYDFSQFSHVVDVGGGDGSFLVSLLKAYPSLRGTVQDLPQVVSGTRRRIEAEGLSERCEVVERSFLDGVHPEGDAYFMKWIIHDWNDVDCTSILTNCRRMLDDGQKVLVVEMIVPPPNTPSLSQFMDLNMLVMLGGLERTEPEYRALFEGAGLRVTSITPTQTEMKVIEAVAA